MVGRVWWYTSLIPELSRQVDLHLFELGLHCKFISVGIKVVNEVEFLTQKQANGKPTVTLRAIQVALLGA